MIWVRMLSFDELSRSVADVGNRLQAGCEKGRQMGLANVHPAVNVCCGTIPIDARLHNTSFSKFTPGSFATAWASILAMLYNKILTRMGLEYFVLKYLAGSGTGDGPAGGEHIGIHLFSW